MPKLINAHCHLELTNLAGKLPRNKPFYEWLTELRKEVADWTKEDYKKSYAKGLELCKKAGTEIVYDVGNQMSEPGFSGFTDFQDFNSFSIFSVHEIIKQDLPFPCTPHSIYATPPELVRGAVLRCREAGIPWSIHLAEFDESDRLSDFLKIFEGELGLVKNGFIVHGNFLKESDLDFMAKNDIALVHCPQSHEFFGHKDPDFEMWKKSGVDICIATDSLASADSLDLTEQLKTLFRRYPKAFTQEEAFAAITSTPQKYLGKTICC